MFGLVDDFDVVVVVWCFMGGVPFGVLGVVLVVFLGFLDIFCWAGVWW